MGSQLGGKDDFQRFLHGRNSLSRFLIHLPHCILSFGSRWKALQQVSRSIDVALAESLEQKFLVISSELRHQLLRQRTLYSRMRNSFNLFRFKVGLLRHRNADYGIVRALALLRILLSLSTKNHLLDCCDSSRILLHSHIAVG